MTADVKARVFEPFFTTKGEHQGAASAVHRIRHRQAGSGFIWVLAGAGTTFRITCRWPNAPRALARTPAAVGGREVILLVEDDAAVRRHDPAARADGVHGACGRPW
jgi:hypothetical protein